MSDRAPNRARLFSPTLFLLWQGQLVSTAGDAIYRIAIGFWILGATGSTALMGALMAATALPLVLASPFGGAVADRLDRRWVLVVCDLVAGIPVLLVGVAGLAGMLEVWMVFAAAMILGLARAFFEPAIDSAIPEIVPPSQLTRANSAFAAVHTSSSILGNSAGGFLLQALGAPLLFLFNGISFILSAISESFARIPRVQREGPAPPLRGELRAGLLQINRTPGLRTLFAFLAVHTFFSTCAFILVLPLFERSPTLGAASFGLLMACFSGGALAGFLLTSALAIPPHARFTFLILAGIADAAALAALPWMPSILPMLALAIIGGLATALTGTVLTTTLQLAVPPDRRGKVLALRGALAMSLSPLAMALAGIAAELFPIPHLITTASLPLLLASLALPLSPATRQLLAGEPDRDREAKGAI